MRCRHVPSSRFSILVVLFLFIISFAPRHLPNAYAQESDLAIDDSESDASAEEPADIGPAPAARPRPTPFIRNLAGTWNGTITGSVFGSGTVQFVISKNRRALRGNYTQSFPAANIVGNFSGSLTANNSTIRMTLISSNTRGCVEKASAQLLNQFEFSGSY